MIAAMLLALVAGAPGPGCDGVSAAARFGDWLADRGDYYRAIGEYQRGLFLGSGIPCAEEQLSLRIARAYALGDQAEAAAASGRELAREASDASVRSEAALVLAYARLRAGAVFAWAAFDAFRARRYGLGTAALAIESLWYGGAIFGAVAGAHRYNRDARALAIEELEGGVRAERDLLPLPPAIGVSARGSF